MERVTVLVGFVAIGQSVDSWVLEGREGRLELSEIVIPDSERS